MEIRSLLTAKPIRLKNSNSATFCKCIESSWRNQYEMGCSTTPIFKGCIFILGGTLVRAERAPGLAK
jgi:hypothetical protein